MTRAERTALVIGAGPAGCSAGIHLARTGWRVTIAEAKAFPRIKVCGEFISPAATGELESLLSPGQLGSLGARRVTDLLISEGERELRFRLPSRDAGGAWVLSRAGLDSGLVDQVRSEGVRVLQPSRVSGVAYSDDSIAADIDGEPRRFDIVVHADGAGRHDAPSPSGGPRTTPMRAGVVGRKCHIRLGESPGAATLLMRSAPGAYVGMVGVEGGLATVALVARKGVVARFGRDADSMLRWLWPEYDPDSRASDWLSCGVASSRFIPGAHLRSFRVGNAGGAVEPVGGEGIGLALWSGRALAESLDAHADLAGARREFARRYRRRLRWRRPSCALAAAILERPRLVRAFWPVLGAPVLGGSVVASWCAMTGKPGALAR